MKGMRLIGVALCAAVVAAGVGKPAAAQIVPLYEPFNYAPGQALAGPVSAGPPVTSAGQVNDNGTPSDPIDDRQWQGAGAAGGTDLVQVVAGNLPTPAGLLAGPTDGSGSASWGRQGVAARIDVGSIVNPTRSGYYSLMLNITDVSSAQLRPNDEPSTNANHNWLFSFSNNDVPATSAFSSAAGARVYARQAPAVEGVVTGYELGITKNSNNNADISWEGVFRPANVPVFLVAEYEITADVDVATLWVNPTSFGGDEPLVGGIVNTAGTDTSIGGWGIRQTGATSNAAFNNSVVVDELRVGPSYASVTPVPEPAGVALLAAGTALAVRRGGRRR